PPAALEGCSARRVTHSRHPERSSPPAQLEGGGVEGPLHRWQRLSRCSLSASGVYDHLHTALARSASVGSFDSAPAASARRCAQDDTLGSRCERCKRPSAPYFHVLAASSDK